MTEVDPLQTLLVEADDIAREDVAEALSPLLRFTRDGALIPDQSFARLPAELRVVAVLLALRAQQMLGVREQAGATPGEVASLSGMPPGTVRPKLAQLLKAHRVARAGGLYSLPIPGVPSACQLLKEATP